MYTDDKNAQVVLALLKKHGIKKIVLSPGMTNVPISRSVQIDPWFEAYSVVDERSAAYFACGLAHESGEPVVISCTGATASRNYLPGLTEAYYRKLPVIALTSQRYTSDYGNLVPQITDRTVSQNDIKKISVHLPVVKDDDDLERCVISVNKALIAATARGGGPVHINLPVDNFSCTTPDLPDIRKIDYINSEGLAVSAKRLSDALQGKKIAVFIGAHRRFEARLQKALEHFSARYSAAVIVDHTSGYRGKNALLQAQIFDLKHSNNKPDLIIDMGSICGEYSIGWLFGIETWRLSEDGEIHDRFRAQTKLFDCSEALFFETLETVASQQSGTNYFAELSKELADFTVPDLPFSNTFISHELSSRLPKNASLHLGIRNSLRNMNFFPLDATIDGSSNVGGFGIDGPISTIIGQSMVNPANITFGLIGDLAAFYDMNALGIRHIANNVRILVVNNNGGAEFRLNETLESQWGNATNEFISARGHNGSMKAWAKDRGFQYLSANNKKEFLRHIGEFCDADTHRFNRPILFEAFTEMEDEQQSTNAMYAANRQQEKAPEEGFDGPGGEPIRLPTKQKIKNRLSRIAPESAKKLYREIRKHA